MFSTSGGVQYIRGCSVHQWDIMSTSGDIMMNVGDTMSTSGDVQYIRGISCMSTLGDVQYLYHDIPHCTEHPMMYP